MNWGQGGKGNIHRAAPAASSGAFEPVLQGALAMSEADYKAISDAIGEAEIEEAHTRYEQEVALHDGDKQHAQEDAEQDETLRQEAMQHWLQQDAAPTSRPTGAPRPPDEIASDPRRKFRSRSPPPCLAPRSAKGNDTDKG